jgi:hypothetical protein
VEVVVLETVAVRTYQELHKGRVERETGRRSSKVSTKGVLVVEVAGRHTRREELE